MLTAAVASRDPKACSNLSALLQQSGLVSTVTEWIAAGRSDWQVPSSGPLPDVLLLDLASDVEAFFQLASQVHRRRPGVRIVACAPWQDPEPEVLLQAMRTGVQDFLPKPIRPAALEAVLKRFFQESSDQDREADLKTIVVLGAKGGVGASMVAVNIGAQLAKLSGKRCLLLDLARPFGHAALMLDLPGKFSIRDAVENIERVDTHFLGGLLVRHKSGLDVLPGISHGEDWQRLNLAHVLRVVNVAQSQADFVVIDGGVGAMPEWKQMFTTARLVLVVSECNVPALWSLERQVTAITALGVPAQRLEIVINRWHRSDDEALKSVEKNLKRQIWTRLPNDFRQVSQSMNLGVPLSRNHNDPLTMRFREIAATISGHDLPLPEKRSGLLSLFANSGKR